MDRHSGSRRPARTPTEPGEALWDWNLVSNRIHFSPGWIALAGCQDHEIGSSPDDWFRRVHPDDRERLLSCLRAARVEGSSEFDLRYRLRHSDGTYRWMWSPGGVVRDEEGAAIRLSGTQVDVTAETVTDPLTGLPNRLLLIERLAQSIERARQDASFGYALVLLEIVRPAGPVLKSRTSDPLLSTAARRVETCLRSAELLACRRQGDVVARLDGDRLAVLLDGLSDPRDALAVGERLLVETLRPFSRGSREVRVSPAVGIVLSATAYRGADDALRDAEAAVHRARVLGGSRCELFDVHALHTGQSDVQLARDFEPALQRGEFQLVYQPIVSIASRRLVGFEALVRWWHPAFGMIPPLDFIPIAERTRFIVPLGRWILRNACAQLREWLATLPDAKDVWISVNVSSVQLRDPDFAGQVEGALRESGLPARSLVLEVTETAAMEDPAAAAHVLIRLRALGIRVSIDDFGTGYSSLAYLRQLPVDTLKLDQSFVRSVHTNGDTVAIVTSIVAMARQLGVHVVAEGIEDNEQLDALAALGCHSAQGYFFSEPLDCDRAAELLAREANAATGSGAGPAAARLGAVRTSLLQFARRTRRLRAGTLAAMGAATCLALFQISGRQPTTVARNGPEPSPSPVEAAGPSALRDAGPPPRADAGRRAPTPVPLRSFPVVHQHRFGSCRGLIRVTSTGVAYVPDEEASDHAIAVRVGGFEHAMAGDTWILRTEGRTYRFRAAPNASKQRDTMSELHKAAAALQVRLR